MIAEQLAGRRIAITGSTGFVGTALVERLLRAVPDCDLVLLIRPGKRYGAAERAQVPQELRVWLRYRCEKYFGESRTPPARGRS